jgi:hypothetical protein
MFILFIVLKNLVIKPVLKRFGTRNGTEYNINGVEYFKFGLHQLQNWGEMLQKQPASATYLGTSLRLQIRGDILLKYYN